MEMRNGSTAHHDIVREYFVRSDAGREDVLDLFTEDAQVYFPKYGLANGRSAMLEIMVGLSKAVSALSHEVKTLISSENMVAAEGLSHGTTAKGAKWSGGKTPSGRFCSIFEIRDGLISRMHVYLDPDYDSEDSARFLWGREGRIW